MKACQQCSEQFQVADDDRKFYEKVSPVFSGKKYPIPDPSLCPDCRQQRRLFWRNERKLYHRKSDLSGKGFISVYAPNKPYVIYTPDEWWSDQWSPLDYGRDFDFSRPFFDQFKELMRVVPRYGILNGNSENCFYSPWIVDSKNCYLSAGGRFNEDCHYTMFPTRSKNCIDCIMPHKSEWCFECLDMRESYSCFYCTYLQNCANCWFSFDCIGCKDCFGCVNLSQKQYYIFNQPYSKEEYDHFLQQYQFSDPKQIKALLEKATQFYHTQPHRSTRLQNCENSTGDLLRNSRNVFHCFDVEEAEDAKYLYDCRVLKDIQDGGVTSASELVYDSFSILDSQRILFSVYCWQGNSDLIYCDSCMATGHLFGCIGLRHKQYCILNKQYSKEEYESVVPKIIEHMKGTEEWGQLFPYGVSPFDYNETTAVEFFPHSKEEVIAKGWTWNDAQNSPPEVKRIIPAERLPNALENIPDEILDWAIECERTKLPFRLIPDELKFYRQFHLPIPRLHPLQRHYDRMKRRIPRKLYSRHCDNCQQEMMSSYSPESADKIFCEKCYTQILF